MFLKRYACVSNEASRNAYLGAVGKIHYESPIIYLTEIPFLFLFILFSV